MRASGRDGPAAPGVVAAMAGLLAGTLQFSGALKGLPGLASLPVDLTLLSALLLAPVLVCLVLCRGWAVRPLLMGPLLAAVLLLLWLVLAGGWSASRQHLAEKLPALMLLGPVMLLAGLLVGADRAGLRWLSGSVVGIGLAIGAATTWGVLTGSVVLGGAAGADPAKIRVQYQLAGLAIACAGGLAALRMIEARGGARLVWAGATLALAAAVLVPGGRAALLGLGLAVAGAPALLLWLRGRPGVALGWVAGVGVVGLGGLALLMVLPGADLGLRTLERFFGNPATATSARVILWTEALRWGGLVAPWGLGPGGFTLAAGSGDVRALHPHNHALEALAEGGLPGLFLWLLAFAGGAAMAVREARHVAPGHASRIAALTLPLALTAMVSTDLGNRMVWFGLGLMLSLAVEAKPRIAEAGWRHA